MSSFYCSANTLSSSSPASRFDAYYNDCINQLEELSVHGVKNKFGWTGLTNRINSCFVNAVLQALLHTPRFAFLYSSKALRPFVNNKNIHGTRGALSGAISALFNAYWSGNFKSIQTRPILDIFGTLIRTDFNGTVQRDAHEFLLFLIIKLSEDINRGSWKLSGSLINYDSSKPLNDGTISLFVSDYSAKQRRYYSSSIVSDLFFVVSCKMVVCDNCPQTTTTFERQASLNILKKINNTLKNNN